MNDMTPERDDSRAPQRVVACEVCGTNLGHLTEFEPGSVSGFLYRTVQIPTGFKVVDLKGNDAPSLDTEFVNCATCNTQYERAFAWGDLPDGGYWEHCQLDRVKGA